MKDRLILTGATGYLGHQLLNDIKHSKQFNRIVATTHNKQPSNFCSETEFIPYNDLVFGNFKLTDNDVICHLSVPRVNSNDPAIANSVKELQFLLDKTISAGVKGVMIASSQAVYGITKPVWTENSYPAPVTSYGWAKYAGEQLLNFAEKNSSTLSGISIRLPKLVGPGIGFRIDMGEWVNLLTYAALQQKRISLSPKFLKQQFDFMDIRDASLIISNILSRSPDTWPKILNIGTDNFISGEKLIHMIHKICKETYQKPLLYKIEELSGDFRDFGMDTTALNNYLECVNIRSLDETISDVARYIISKN